MTAAEARAAIEHLTQWQADPALTSAEVDWLLTQALTTDAAGAAPGDAAYADTYTTASVNHAVALGFDLKAAKVAGAYDVKAGGAEARLSQQATQLAARGRRYRAAGGIGSIALTTAIAEAS